MAVACAMSYAGIVCWTGFNGCNWSSRSSRLFAVMAGMIAIAQDGLGITSRGTQSSRFFARLLTWANTCKHCLSNVRDLGVYAHPYPAQRPGNQPSQPKAISILSPAP